MKSILIVIFGVLLIGLSIFFYTYKGKIKEYFQVDQSSGNIFETDTFLDSLAIPTSYDLSGFSLIRNLVTDHINFVTNINNYNASFRPIKRNYNCPAYGLANAARYYYNEGIYGSDGDYNDALKNLRDEIGKYVYNFRANGPYYNFTNYGVSMSNFNGLPSWRNDYREIRPYCKASLNFGSLIDDDTISQMAELNPPIFIVEPVIAPIKVTRYSIPVVQEAGLAYRRAAYNYYYNGSEKFNLASSEILRLNVYGSINANQLNDFKRSQLYGLVFNFVDTNSIDKYLRIPYDSSKMDGTDLYFSHGKFLPEVVPCNDPRLFYLYNSDTSNIAYNDRLVSFLTDTTLAFPADFTYNTVVTVTPTNVIPLNTVPLTHKYIDKIVPSMLSLLPQSSRQYITSWGYNRTIRILERRLQDLTTNTSKINFLLDRATTAGLAPFLSEYNSKRGVAITDSELSDAIFFYKQNIRKIIPDYGGTINIQNSNFLNTIAQKYYEYSEGLSEMIYIYEILRVGSNMLDIRFDKKQRLPPNEFINLRNTYNYQILDYNRLLDMYSQNTWGREFNSVTDIQNALSTATVKIDAVLNPVYPIGGLGTLNSLRSQFQANITNMISLSNQILTLGTQVQTTAGASNISSIMESQLANVNSLVDIQTQYNSTLEAEFRLSNLINGITTGVARVFYTNGANPTVDGMALGINAALSYNTIYNGNLEIDMGNTPGNVNYTPQIIYTKNIIPPIDCTNVDFMKRAAQLYEDSVLNTSLSTFTNGIYNSNVGEVIVDKILGFKQVDNTTCGYTWQETEYDFYTNQPTVRRIMNVILPFKFDNAVYQDPQILIDNNLSNGIQIINRGTIPINRNNLNITSYNTLLPQLTSFRTQYTNLLSLNLTEFNRISNIYITENDFIYDYNLYTSLPKLPGTVPTVLTAVVNNRATLDYFKNLDNYKSLNIILNASILNNAATLIANKNFYDTFIENSNNLSKKILNLENIINSLSNSISNYTPLISGCNFPFTTLEKQSYITRLDDLLTFNNRILSNPTPSQSYTWGTTSKDDMLLMFNYFDTNEDTIINNSISNSNYFKETTKREITSATSYRTFDYLDPTSIFGGVNSFTNSYFFNNLLLFRTLKATILNIEYSQSNNVFTIPRSLSDNKIYLDNAEGVCPNLYTCGSPEIMNQVMEQYNNDDSNTNVILRILNAYTVSPYQCDYKVELKNKLDSNIIITTRTFQIGLDYKDCTYYIGDYGSNNMGWYISENQNPTAVANSCNSQVQGYQYIGGVLSDYYNSVLDVINPYIKEGSNTAINFFDAITKQRLDTYSALGSFRTLSTNPQCSNIDYFQLINIISNNQRFKKSLFSIYYRLNSDIRPNKILRVGIFNSNSFDVVFDTQNINNNFSLGNRNTNSARFSITTTSEFCDYTPVFISNIPPFPPRAELINLSNLQSVNTYNGLNSNYSDLNILTPSLPLNITFTKGLLHKIANFMKPLTANYQPEANPQTKTILGYAIIKNLIYLKIFYSATSPNPYYIISIPYNIDNSIFNDIQLLGYFITTRNAFNINRVPEMSSWRSSDGLTYFTYPNSIMIDISSYNLKLSDFESNTIFNTPSGCTAIDFNSNSIKTLTGLHNIISYIPDSSDPNICEYRIDTSPEILPISKQNFKVKLYVNNILTNNCTNIEILYINPVDDINNSLFLFRPTDASITNQTLLNLFRNHYNSINSISNGKPYNSIITRFNYGVVTGTKILYNVSVFYTDINNNYLTNMLPNDGIFVFNKIFTVQYILDFINTTYTVGDYSLIDNALLYNNTTPDYIQDPDFYTRNQHYINIQNKIDITDANAITTPSVDFFLQNIKYKYIRIDPINDFNDYTGTWMPETYPKFQLSQLQFYKDTINQNLNIINIYEIKHINPLVYNYNNNTNIRFLYNLNNITNIANFDSYENTFKNKDAQIVENIYGTFTEYGSLYPTSLLIEFNVPISIDGFSFVSGFSRTKQLKRWKIYGILNQMDLNNINRNNWFNYNNINDPNVLFLHEQTIDLVYNTRYYQSPSFTFIPTRTNITLSQLTNIPVVLDMNTCVTPTSSLFNSYKTLIKNFGFNDLRTRVLNTSTGLSIMNNPNITEYSYLSEDQPSSSPAISLDNINKVKIYYIKLDNNNYRINLVLRVKIQIGIRDPDTNIMVYDGIKFLYFNYYIDLDESNPCTYNNSIDIEYDANINDKIYDNGSANIGGNLINYILTDATSDGVAINTFFTNNGFTVYTEAFTNYSRKRDTTLYEVSPKKSINMFQTIKKNLPLTKETLQKYYKQKVNDSIQPEFNKTLYDRLNNTYYLMFDEYDLNQNMLRKNMIIGMKFRNSKCVDVIYYEDDNGNRDAFDLSKKEVKYFWNTKIGLPLAFEEF